MKIIRGRSTTLIGCALRVKLRKSASELDRGSRVLEMRRSCHRSTHAAARSTRASDHTARTFTAIRTVATNRRMIESSPLGKLREKMATMVKSRIRSGMRACWITILTILTSLRGLTMFLRTRSIIRRLGRRYSMWRSISNQKVRSVEPAANKTSRR